MLFFIQFKGKSRADIVWSRLAPRPVDSTRLSLHSTGTKITAVFFFLFALIRPFLFQTSLSVEDARGLPDDLKLASPRSVLGSWRSTSRALTDGGEDARSRWSARTEPLSAFSELMKWHVLVPARSHKHLHSLNGDITSYLYTVYIYSFKLLI